MAILLDTAGRGYDPEQGVIPVSSVFLDSSGAGHAASEFGSPEADDGLPGPTWTSVISRSRSYSRGTSGFTNPNNFVTGFTQVHSCYLYTVVHSAQQIKLSFGAYAYGTDIGNALPITHVAVEYPHNSGKFFDVLFSGSQSVTLNSGQTILSDALDLSSVGGVVAGQVLNVRTYINGIAVGANWPVFDDAYTGDKLTASTGTTSDLTHTAYGSLTADKSAGYGPQTIYGNVVAHSVVAIGDSITQSVGDTINGPPAGIHAGWVDRGFANAIPLLDTSRHAERGDQWFGAVLAHRRGMAYSGDRVIVAYGNNDFYTGTNLTAVQMENVIIPLWRAFNQRGYKVWAVTVTPRTTSTDSFATSVNQTPVANGAARIAYNQWLRDGAPMDNNSQALATGTTPGANVFRMGSSFHPIPDRLVAKALLDISSVVETATDSGIWKNVAANGTGPWTADGTHPAAIGHTAAGALITVSDFTS